MTAHQGLPEQVNRLAQDPVAAFPEGQRTTVTCAKRAARPFVIENYIND